MEKYDGNYIPPGFQFTGNEYFFSLNNTDASIDTPDGRNSFQATDMAVYQREPSAEGAIDVVVKYVTDT